MKYYIYTVYEDLYGNKNYNEETEDGWYSAYGKFITNVSSSNCVSCKVTYFDLKKKEKIALNYQVPEI